MKIGNFRLEQLSEGIFEISSGGAIQKVRDHQATKPAVPSVERVGLDPVLLDTGHTLVMLDAGLGMGLDNSEPDRNTSNLLTNLDVLGYRPEDISHVILSHLHYDHVAGLSHTSQNGNIAASLPNARIYVQKEEWNTAMQSLSDPQKNREAGYDPDDLYRLVADDRFVFLEKERQEILKGLTIIRTGGHTPGHQVVRIRDKKETAYFCGDLIPSEFYLNHHVLSKVDMDTTKARKARILLMQEAHRDQATLLFYHSVYHKAGKVTMDKHRKFVLRTKQ